MSLNASVFVSEQLNRLMVNTAQELAQRAISACAEHYNFDAEEAIRLLGLRNVKLERKDGSVALKGEKKEKVVIAKPKLPLPYNGELNENYCYALRQNNGLYTQCNGIRKSEKNYPDGKGEFCKSCVKAMRKTGELVPEYGTIQSRKAVGIFEYVDPKGRKPVAYTKVMKKFKITKEEVVEEAGKFNITINDNHFISPEEENKRGRRAKEVKEEKVKGVKGRPKKEKKVLQIEGDDDDLFAALVEEANAVDDVCVGPSAEEEEAKKKAEEEEKAVKAAKKEQERLEREAKKKAEEEEKAVKAAKKEQDRLEREAKKKAEEEEKAVKAAKKEQERLEREAKKKAEEEEKIAKKKLEEEAKASKKKAEGKSKKAVEKEVEEEEEQDVVKKIEYNGKKYLKSKKTGIIYDYAKLKDEGEQVKVGKWNESENKIDFDDDEESEDEYDD